MKYLFLIASLLLGLCSPSSAQFNGCQAGFCSPKSAAAPLSPVTLTYQMTARAGGTSPNEVFSITFLSALAAGQRVAVFFNDQNFFTSGPLISAVFTPNIGSPVTALITDAGTDTAPGDGFHSICASAVMPTGATSTTLTLTFTSTTFANASFAAYTLNDAALSSSTPTFTFQPGTTTPLSASIATPAGSGLVGTFLNLGTSFGTWTGLTSDAANFNTDSGHISNATASASYPVSYAWTSGAGTPDLTLWVYR